MMKKTAILCGWLAMSPAAFGAIGCTLSNPARDLKTLFPAMTSYREDVKELGKLPQGRAGYEALRERVGGDLDPVYEAFDTPYTLYSVFQGAAKIGYVHGVNVPGRGGVIQIFLAVDPATAAIGRMFYQRLESPGGTALRNPAAIPAAAGFGTVSPPTGSPPTVTSQQSVTVGVNISAHGRSVKNAATSSAAVATSASTDGGTNTIRWL